MRRPWLHATVLLTMPSYKPRPGAGALPPGTVGISQALGHSDPLTLLTRRVRESQARLVALAPLLPPAMRPWVKAGPLDDEGFTLLAGNPAVAAKLRQMLPTLEARLRQQGWPGPALRIKLLVG